MLISVEALTRVWGIKPTGVLHIGAHEAEELGEYEAFGWGNVIWVEAQPEKALELEARLAKSSHTVINGAAWDVSGQVLKLNIASNGQSTSLLELGTHAKNYPNVTYVNEVEVITSRLEDLVNHQDNFNFANFDVQGTELNCIKGLGDLIEKIDWIYTEVNKKQVYKNCTLVSDLDLYLKECGFSRIDTRWVLGKGWGDALYARNTSEFSKKQKLRAFMERSKWNVVPITRFFEKLRHLISKVVRSK